MGSWKRAIERTPPETGKVSNGYLTANADKIYYIISYRLMVGNENLQQKRFFISVL